MAKGLGFSLDGYELRFRVEDLGGEQRKANINTGRELNNIPLQAISNIFSLTTWTLGRSQRLSW